MRRDQRLQPRLGHDLIHLGQKHLALGAFLLLRLFKRRKTLLFHPDIHPVSQWVDSRNQSVGQKFPGAGQGIGH